MRFKRKNVLCLSALFFIFAGFGYSQSGKVKPAPTPDIDESETVKILTEEIKINVIAFDEAGKFVTDVKDTDLVINENNILHQATTLRRTPANVLIVMDTGGELRAVKSLDKTRGVAKALVNSLSPEDYVAVMQYSDKAEIVGEWTKDRSQLMDIIGKQTGFGRRSAFIQALQLAQDFLSKNPMENKHLVLITDGTDSVAKNTSTFDAFQRLLSTDINVHVLSYTTMEIADVTPRSKGISKTPPPRAMPPEIAAQLPNGARDAAQAPRIGVTINTDKAMMKKYKTRKAELESSEEALTSLATNTNGEIVLAKSQEEMVDKTGLIAKMIDSSYILTYTPKFPLGEPGNENVRNIEVTSRRPGLIVYAKRKLIVRPI